MRAAAAPVLDVSCCLRVGDFRLDATFTAGPGITVLFGPSGAGKTTILELVAGLRRPDRGRISLGGDVLVDTERKVFVAPHKRRIGMVFQDAQLFPHLTVEQNLAFGRWFSRGRPATIPPASVLEILGLAPLLQRRPARLSGGEKQRVSLARALLAAPRLLLMDEPLGAVDDGLRREILPLIEQVRDEFAIPMLYVTHAREEAQRLAQDAVLIDRGRIVAFGPAATVLA